MAGDVTKQQVDTLHSLLQTMDRYAKGNVSRHCVDNCASMIVSRGTPAIAGSPASSAADPHAGEAVRAAARSR